MRYITIIGFLMSSFSFTVNVLILSGIIKTNKTLIFTYEKMNNIHMEMMETNRFMKNSFERINNEEREESLFK